MIGQLRGNLIVKKPPYLILDVNGVGYELQASMTTIYALPELNQQVTLFTHMVVREDAQLLYAFFEETERATFRELIKISGVGPKLALSILSGISVSGITQCIEEGDVSRLVKIPGVGKKTAERLLVEMKNRLNLTATIVTNSVAEDDAVSALVALGYRQQDAHVAIRKVNKQGAVSEDLIKSALQTLVK